MKTYIFKTLTIILAFLLPIKPLLLIVGGTIFLDTIFGIWKAKRIGEKITSNKLSNIISKMLLYQLTIILMYSIELFILKDFVLIISSIPFLLTKIVALSLASVELTSINENYAIISGKDLFKTIAMQFKRAKQIKDEFKND